MAEFLFSLIVGTADLALTRLGGVLVRLLSFGHWQAEPLLSRRYRSKARAGAHTYIDGATRVVTHTGQLAAALLFCVLLILGASAAVV